MTNNTLQESAGVTRRDFLKKSATATAGAAAFATFFTVSNSNALTTGENSPDPVAAGVGQSIGYRFSTCQNCHSRCGIMCKVVGPTGSTDPAAGVLVKIEGNAFHPHCKEEDERLTNADSVAEAITDPGRLCPKGQAGVQVLYDPYRIKHPLKRVGSRGSGQWEVISWGDVMTEIAAQINALIPTATRFTTPINPLYPTLGWAANGLAFSPGRLPDREATNKIMFSTYGTINERLDHTSICEVSHHVSNEHMTAGAAKIKDHFKPDVEDCSYLMLFGANYLEANFPMLGLARKVVDMKKKGGKLVVVDPRFSNTAAKADIWLPVRPGTDGAVALGMATHIIKDEIGLTTIAAGQTDGSNAATYLRNATKGAANANNETCWTDATRLVIVSTAGIVPAAAVPGAYLRATDVTLGAATDYVCLVVGVPTGYTSSGAAVVHGDLLGPPGGVVIGAVGGGTVTCKPVYQILYETSIAPYTVDYYAGIAGVDTQQLKDIAADFYGNGKTAVANPYRGTVQHTNGMSAMQAVTLLNLLVGNYDWKGGNLPGAGGPSPAYTGMAGSNPPAGIITGPRIDRAQVSTTAYSTLHTANPIDWPYPAKRPWFSQASHGNYQEIIPGILNQYPYPIKVLITYWNNLAYATPALKNVFLTTVMDTGKLPLFVAIDNVMGEVSAYADYILPDTTYLEKWAFPGGSNLSFKTQYVNFRQPVVGSYDGKAWDDAFVHTPGAFTQPTAPAVWAAPVNNYNPIYPDTLMYEDILIRLMNALGLTREIGLGTGGANVGNYLPPNAYAHSAPAIDTLVTNTLAAIAGGTLGHKAGITADDVIARGGVFQDPGNGDDTTGISPNIGKVRVKWANELRLYYPGVATAPDVMTSSDFPVFNTVKTFAPVATSPAVAKWEEVKDVKGNPVIDGAWPFQLITYKSVLHAQARTQNLPWLTCWGPENFIDMNAADAAALGLQTYDLARVSSPSAIDGIVGRVKVTEGLRPGVVAISHSFGHWQQGGTGWQQDGVNQATDPTRTMGISANPIMRLDPVLGDVSLQDKIGGSCSFYDTRVKVEKVAL